MPSKPNLKKIIISSTLLLLIAISSKSQTIQLPDISADRPGMATTPFILLPQKLQIETGFSFEKIQTKTTIQETTLYNSSLIRYGINENSESRLQMDYAHVKTDSFDIKGIIPLTIRTKLLV
jgi:hypothetical protein